MTPDSYIIIAGASLYNLLKRYNEDNGSFELDNEALSAGSKQKLESFLSECGNELCADCGSPNPKWVSANLGAFVCIKCSGVHRSLGVHISKILSVNLDEWTEVDVNNVIKLGGNIAVNLKYENSIPSSCRKPQSDSSIDDRTDFIKRKYVMQQFLNKDEQLSCPFTPSALRYSSTGLNNVLDKKYINSMRIGQAILNNRKRKDAEQKPTKKSQSTAGMVEFVGLIKVNVVRGIDLVIRDVRSSDPYVMLSLGNQSVRTRVIKKNLNPIWNETLMLSIPDNVPPLIVCVFDKDKFTTDDFMGEAEFDIDPLVAAANDLEIRNPSSDPSKKIEKVRDGKGKNPVVNNGMITVADGKAKQGVVLKLENVESGEIEIEIECVPLTQ
ncbi:probable ADP-ribosylation factor GTPase-activating protein AGD11 [Rutidosis leptorrhynchoides]|uniref:probable ADP-ribosylation factor GTPase-activating protein AGD11 n=1 Tax=Rutidosis leptorrhynchoides TaxID=125765 RepID=UPI003A99BDE2